MARKPAMAEAEWLASRDPGAMMEAVRTSASARKLYLLCLACGCMYKFTANGKEAMAALEVAAEADDPREAVRAIAPRHLKYGFGNEPFDLAQMTARGWRHDVGEKHAPPLIRELFGNPFRAVAFDPAWRTTDATLLARGIYDEKAFDRMPILADALQDAGCEAADILDHLRDRKQKHVRGCWALDLVLGRE
jgi:hypothetical protein